MEPKINNSARTNDVVIANLTRGVLVAGIAGHLTLGAICLLGPEEILSYLWLPPFDQVPAFWLRTAAGIDLAFAIGGIYAIRQNHWNAARTFLGLSGIYIAAFVSAITLSYLFGGSDRPLIVWFYVSLALLYLPLILFVWRQESLRLRHNA